MNILQIGKNLGANASGLHLSEKIMPTKHQELGEFGEVAVIKNCHCPKCKRTKALKRLPINFKCADIICDFCGYLAQVKSQTVKDISVYPKQILGAAWGPQKERMDAGIYFPLFIVTYKNSKEFSVFYLSADMQLPEMFVARKPLSVTARRAGWQGYIVDLTKIIDKALVKIR